jgi:hypothetical protein
LNETVCNEVWTSMAPKRVASNITPAKCRSRDRPNIGQSSLQLCMAVWCSGYTVLFLSMLLMLVFSLRGFESCGKQYFFQSICILFHLPPPSSPYPIYLLNYYYIIISGWLSYSDVEVRFSLSCSRGCFGRGLVSGWFKGWSELEFWLCLGLGFRSGYTFLYC